MSCIVSILNSLKAAFIERALFFFFFFSCGFTNFGVSAAVGQAVSSDSHKPVLDRLESITTLPISDFRFHSDMAHPEDPTLDDSNWERVKVGEKWSNGSRVLRRSVEIPAKLNGYSTQGARVKLELN